VDVHSGCDELLLDHDQQSPSVSVQYRKVHPFAHSPQGFSDSNGTNTSTASTTTSTLFVAVDNDKEATIMQQTTS
jgi:hypothetical protein